MRNLLAALVAVALILAPAVLAGPIEPFGGEPGYLALQVEPFSVRSFAREFKGQESASVIAIGSGVTPMALYVYDVHGNCVAWDDLSLSHENVSDDLVAQWRPATTAKYEVEVRNQGRLINPVQIAVR